MALSTSSRDELSAIGVVPYSRLATNCALFLGVFLGLFMALEFSPDFWGADSFCLESDLSCLKSTLWRIARSVGEILALISIPALFLTVLVSLLQRRFIGVPLGGWRGKWQQGLAAKRLRIALRDEAREELFRFFVGVCLGAVFFGAALFLFVPAFVAVPNVPSLLAAGVKPILLALVLLVASLGAAAWGWAQLRFHFRWGKRLRSSAEYGRD